jgi:hypothetical protein
MEITIRPRTIVLTALGAALIVAACFVLRPHLPAIQALAGIRTAPIKPTATPLPTAAPGTTRLTFESQSTTWRWEATCEQPLLDYLRQYPLRTLRVVLVDAQMSVGVAGVSTAYPDVKGEHAQAVAGCEGTINDLTCQVYAKTGQRGNDLDMAVTTVVPYAVQQYFMLRTLGSADAIDALRRNWSWSRFQPLVRKEGDAWRANCLAVSGRS